MDERFAVASAARGEPWPLAGSRRVALRYLFAGGLGALGMAGGWAEAGVAWRRCRKCRGFFLSGGGDGVCPKGGRHSAQGSKLYGTTVGAPGPGEEGGWRQCAQCRGMFWGGSGPGVCPAGGGHLQVNATNFVFTVNQPPAAGEEAGWRYCPNCHGLFFALGKKLGKCPAGGAHEIHPGFDYVLRVVR